MDEWIVDKILKIREKETNKGIRYAINVKLKRTYSDGKVKYIFSTIFSKIVPDEDKSIGMTRLEFCKYCRGET